MEILVLIGLIFLIFFIIGLIIEVVKAIFRGIIGLFCCIFELIAWLFQKIIAFVVKHIKVILGILLLALMITLLVVYIQISEEPFAFIPKIWNYVMQGHNIPGMIVGGGTLLGVCLGLVKLGVLRKSKYCRIINSFLMVIFVVLAMINRVLISLSVSYMMCFLLYEGYRKVMSYTFGTEEMKHTVPHQIICLAWNYLSMLYSVVVLQFPIEMWNRQYNTSIKPDNIVLVFSVFVNCLLCFSGMVVFVGVKKIRNTVKRLGIFDWNEIVEAHQDKYEKEYVAAVLEHMNSFFCESIIEEKEWMTQKYLLFWKKRIQQGKRIKEIEHSYHYSLHNHTFREIYIQMYQYFQGVCLDFSIVQKEKAAYYKNESIFQMCRYQIEEHPVLREKGKFLNRYFLNRNDYLCQFCRTCGLGEETNEPEYIRLRWLEGLCQTKEQKEQLDSMIKKQNYLSKSFKQGKNDYQILLVLEILYFVKLLAEEKNIDFQFEWIEELAESIGVSAQKNVFLYRFFQHGMSRFDSRKLRETYEEYRDCFQDELPKYFIEQLIANAEYIAREETHVAICATVSSGKSTFLNTILGKNLMPNRMTACTARMSVIRVNEHLSKPISVIESKNREYQYDYDISSEKMDEINGNDQIERVLTEISLPLFAKANKILYFHDSPGVNNSMNEAHHEVTLNFLKTEKPEWILFLIDAQQDTVNDNINLLKEVGEHIEKKANVIFIYNKVDCLKEEDGDDLDENLSEVKKMIQEQGFYHPRIFPISAKAAQLFAEVLQDHYFDFTKEDERLFRECYRFFKKKKNDMTEYFEEEIRMVRNKEYDCLDRKQIVSIKGRAYSKGEVLDAWYRTGIYAVTEWILQYMSGKEEKE